MTDMVDQDNTIQVTPIKINGKSWTPTLNSKRLDPITGKYNNKPIDPEYFNKYYTDNLKDAKVQCPNCNCMCPKKTQLRHMRSSKCKKQYEILQRDINFLIMQDINI